MSLYFKFSVNKTSWFIRTILVVYNIFNFSKFWISLNYNSKSKSCWICWILIWLIQHFEIYNITGIYKELWRISINLLRKQPRKYISRFLTLCIGNQTNLGSFLNNLDALTIIGKNSILDKLLNKLANIVL